MGISGGLKVGVGLPPWGMGQGGTPVVLPPSAAGPGGQPQVNSLTLQIPLPEVLPIPDAHEFNPAGSVGSNVVQAGVNITGVTVVVPDGMYAVIRSVGLTISNMLATTNVTWSLVVNGVAPQGYNAITIVPRVAPFVAASFDSMIRFNGPATVQMIFSNIDGGAYTIGGSFSGWFWPVASDARWKRLGQ